MTIKRQMIGAAKAAVFTLPLCGLLMGCKQETGSSTSGTGSAPESKATTAEADNSAKNTRDRDEAALTSGDQGNSQADRDITQKVRRTLVAAGEYSTTAKNVKIITADGKVTLRGPVKSEAEKTGIAAIAKSVVGEGNVDDQLEIKANP